MGVWGVYIYHLLCFVLLGVVVDLIAGLERLHVELCLVLARNMPAHGVVPCKRARTEWTRYANPLVPLSYVGAQVRLVPVESLAKRTLELLSYILNAFEKKLIIRTKI